MTENLMPKPPMDKQIRLADSKAKAVYKSCYDKHHGVRSLVPLNRGDTVLIRPQNSKKWIKEGKVISSDQENRTYLVNTPTGLKRRNRQQLKLVPSPVDKPTPASPVKEDQTAKAEIQDPQSPRAPPGSPLRAPPLSPRITRSMRGIPIVKPVRFRDE